MCSGLYYHLHGDLEQQRKTPPASNTWDIQLFPQPISIHKEGQYYSYYKDEDTRPPVGEGTSLCHATGWRGPAVLGQKFHCSNSQYVLHL